MLQFEKYSDTTWSGLLKLRTVFAVLLYLVSSFVTSAQSESPVLYSSLTSKLPDLITLLALVTESVNHAAVVPTSKVPQRPTPRSLAINARFVLLLLLIFS